jgi:DNA replication licensing factor MCM4
VWNSIIRKSLNLNMCDDSLFKTYLDVVHVSLISGTDGRLAFDRTTRPAGGDRVPGVGTADIAADLGLRSERDDDGAIITSKRHLEERLNGLSQREDIYELLASSLAPSIYAMADVKKGGLALFFFRF